MRLTKFSFGIARHKKIDSSKLSLHKDSIVKGPYVVEDAPLEMLDDSTVDAKGSQVLDFKSERKLDFKEKFSQISRGTATNFASGGPIYPVHTEEEIRQKIIDLDQSCSDYKKGHKKRLLHAWNETLKVTKPHLFDNKLSNSAIKVGQSPDTRNSGYKVG